MFDPSGASRRSVLPIAGVLLAAFAGVMPSAAAGAAIAPRPGLRLASVSPAAKESRPFRPPVPGPVTRPFDEPNGPYGSGHRGLDYDVHPGDAVAAVGGGVVVFVGSVAGHRFVTVLHVNGLRSTYGYVDSVLVRRGQRVSAGNPVATSSVRLLLTIRAGERYLDPAGLIASEAGSRRHAHLVRWNADGWWW